MNGFIHESVSKIADGFGSTIKLLFFLALTTLAFIPVKSFLGLIGVISLLILISGLAGFYFYRSFRNSLTDKQKAWCGMASGVLFWQVTRYLPVLPGTSWFDRVGLILWLGLVLLVFLYWRHLVNPGIKFFSLTFLINWLGWMYLDSLNKIEFMPHLVSSLYQSLHYLGIAGFLVCTWWLVTRSHNGIERKYAGLGLYFSILFTFLFF